MYLLVPGCNGYGENYNGIEKLEFSYNSLRKYCSNINKVYLYIGYDDTSIQRIERIEEWVKDKDIILKNFGKLEHSFETSYKGGQNPLRLNILIEKIKILQKHDTNEDICFVDIDTEFKENFLSYKFDLSIPIFHEKEYPMLSARNLKAFFESMNYDVGSDIYMYNSGIIYIPKDMRSTLTNEAFKLVLEMNKYPDNTRHANDLDEQIALSIVVSKFYNNRINVLRNYITHHWDKVHSNIAYWN